MPNWTVEFISDFHDELKLWPEQAQDELLAKARLIEEFGPSLKRPHADTLKGSKYANMKELRFDAADGVWRVAFAFDPARRSIILVGGDKSGSAGTRFYRRLITMADRRFGAHLASLKHTR